MTNVFQRRSQKAFKKKKEYKSTALGLLFIFQVLALFLVLIFDIKNITKIEVFTCFGIILLTFLSIKIVGKITKGNDIFLIIVSMLYSIGIVMIYRLDPFSGRRQLIFFIVGVIFFFITYFLLKIFNNWQNYTMFYFIVSIMLFFATLVFGYSQGGAKNWISLGNFSLQPSEFIKIPFVFFIASFYSNYEKYSKKPFGRFFMTTAIYLFIGLFFLQRELGTAIIFFGVMILSQFVYDKDRKLIFFNIILMVFGMIAAYFLFSHVRVRVTTWLDPWSVINDQGYQITQSLFAMASGGLFGTGIGAGRPDFIPVAVSDFIFSAIVEEMGIFMGIGLIFLFLILVYQAIKISLMQQNRFYSILSFCTGTLFGIQAFVIFAGVMKIIPLTGVTIPFVSYGGSSMLSGFILLAVLQRTSEKIKGEEDE
ncbi:MAG: FtsW/RodA/SpoVE family cell cycle protein [Peptoniphilaceae bacterium]|nr:FtsW/RodA/SpoVE family cell cycle protein [Peptoniphilaceae bacterium]MDD7383542.1 FtsW/RodA/SpoVE family cell cycle protein [Peptoniphilaceae bacterium]MDY3738715.1 FtsW/RodA/SpoVE family cell cycle protein [Peptoniphilaceae bacterium]